MEFGLSEEQIALQDSVNRFLNEQVPLDRVRQFADDEDDTGREIWDGLAELGVPALLIPEEYGGVGLKALDAAIVAESLGAHVTPAPFLSTAVLAPKALLLGGTEEQQAQYLPKIADGTLTFGAALSEVPGARRDAGVTARDGKLSGKALFVVDVQSDKLLVADKSRALHVVDTDADGVSVTVLPQVDRTRPIAQVIFDDAAAELLPGSSDPEVALTVIDTGRVVLAADTLGAGQEMLDQAVAYAMQREQFNRVIASFQAVKHMCAEMAAELEPSRSMVWYAAYALDEMPEEARLTACHTKAHLADVGQFVGKTSTMVHGGMGFTDLLGLHYWFKRMGFNRQILGGPETVREEAARVQGLV